MPGSEPATFKLSVEFSAVLTSLHLRERTIQTARKGKVVPVHAVTAYGGEERDHHLFVTSALDGGT